MEYLQNLMWRHKIKANTRFAMWQQNERHLYNHKIFNITARRWKNEQSHRRRHHYHHHQHHQIYTDVSKINWFDFQYTVSMLFSTFILLMRNEERMKWGEKVNGKQKKKLCTFILYICEHEKHKNSWNLMQSNVGKIEK